MAAVPDIGAAGPGQTRYDAGVAVAVRDVGKRFGAREVLHEVRLGVTPGDFVAIVGKSGCGKSTLLRLLAGLDAPSAGSVLLDGVPVAGIAAQARIMYQDARLLPWQTVVDNVALGLPGKRAARREQALAALAQVGLADRADEWPSVLSGGQRQRVALARALVHRPRLLLLDEPLGALDALTRIDMQGLIEQLWQTHGFTALLVTHDVSEAVALANRVVIVDAGRIALDRRVELGRPRERGDARYAALEGEILDRLLAHPERQVARVA
ncbi:ATP-binding cassette domain-containing protein [Orrella dioscoreae]|uniref:Alkanesulfonates ABC transporter ATP-binding protein / Sulfonate ABC transporter, ATP-binding subunit SsuB n=1 Tax=Orrella dioscoreae TaxID=1851544 RepID=A0A1C3K6E1_9BURK|nr:ATP-binding cassette domain-containing protein [Orrella dioscoreae]SBT27099.1 Alkanesulfonates ABC transporter ATP-binding protein / Sulfonate ABC transporter, ATP-binding subunit SsuB [Orrella dioscoreae]SOE45917.1 Alkanesulfonates ABC transporter ATP-binding protein / Sulfonate ABC transporter, ATP-binding subunit SsuB [Orrella dioscoreae]